MDKEKQRKILDAAFEEFARHGYKKASTNRIVKAAGISKGVLFYYFNNKEELYHDLIDIGVSFVRDEYIMKIDDSVTDFLEKYKSIAQLKMKVYLEHPAEFHFFGSLYLHPDEGDQSREAAKMLAEVRKLGFAKVYDNIDTTLFREDLSPEQCMQMIRWCMDGYEKELTAKLNQQEVWYEIENFDPYWNDFFEFIERMKTIFYSRRK